MKQIYIKYFKTIALIWAGCFILFLFVGIFVLAPHRKSKKQIEEQLTEKKQIYDFALKAAREETKLKLNKQIEHLQSELSGFVTDFEDSANLTFDISQIASEKKVASFSIKAKENDRSEEIPNCHYLGENQVNVSFSGGFNQFATFLNALERHRPVVFVNKFAIVRSSKNDSNHKVNMNLAFLVRKKQDG